MRLWSTSKPHVCRAIASAAHALIWVAAAAYSRQPQGQCFSGPSEKPHEGRPAVVVVNNSAAGHHLRFDARHAPAPARSKPPWDGDELGSARWRWRVDGTVSGIFVRQAAGGRRRHAPLRTDVASGAVAVLHGEGEDDGEVLRGVDGADGLGPLWC
jgi:hypothetical protein